MTNQIHRLVLLAVCASLLANQSVLAESPGLLRLAGGDFVPGTLADSTDRQAEQRPKLAWQYSGFSAPLEFDLGSILSASFPTPPNNEPARGRFAIELTGGDRIFGQILAINDWTIRIDSKPFGELTLLRSAVKRISRWDDGQAMIFIGPGSVQQWQTVGAPDAWQSEGGGLRTVQDKVSAFRDIGLPHTVRIETELSWEGKPNFVLAIGVDAKNTDESDEHSFRIEVWDDEVVLLRELTEVADVIPLGKLASFDGGLRFSLEIHQNDGRVIARSPQGKTLGEFTLPANDSPDIQPGVRLTNISGNVSLDSFTVMQVGVEKAGDANRDDDTMLLVDHSLRSGRWTGVSGGQWTFLADEATTVIDPRQVLSIDLAAPTQEASEHTGLAQIATHGGVRLSGSVHSIADGKLHWQSPMIEEIISLDTAQVARIAVDGRPRPVAGAGSADILGRLHFPGGRLTGRLVDTAGELEPTPLRFAPRAANTVHLTTGFSGKMVYRETPPPETAQQQRIREQREAAAKQQARRRGNQGGVWNALARAFGNNSATQQATVVSPSVHLRSMHLRSGEVIPCDVETIDENGVVFHSDVTSETRLPQNQVRAIALTEGCRDPEIEVARKDRLLTVPRIRKKNRPTHLVVASNGDILRCRLLSLDKESLVVETRLEKITIKRSLIAQIIWLKEEPDAVEGDDSTENPPSTELAARAVLRNGNRMSLIVTAIDDSVLIGEHPLLGESRIKLGDVNELLIGIDINEVGADQPYSGWQLKDAPEPIIPAAGEAGGAASGLTSPLVGQPAPDFTLDLLDGTQFSVANQRGKVLVLDFWATWCGPCLQAMPVIEKTIAEFDENEVRLIAVNLQETAEPIRATLARLKISPEVALDIDGVAAARYQADAIPQTVVIGRDGKITRVFVGSGGGLANSLRAAIEEALKSDK